MEFQVQALRTMTAITVKELRLQKTVKERNLQRKIDRGEDMIVAHNNQSSQNRQLTSIPVNRVQRHRLGSDRTKTPTRKQITAEIKIGKQQRC